MYRCPETYPFALNDGRKCCKTTRGQKFEWNQDTGNYDYVMEEWGETRRKAWDAWDCEGGWENSEICQDAMPSGTQPSPAPCENFKGQDISQIIC